MSINISISNLTKRIKDRDVLKDITIELESGNVYGFVGRNGSGKTMLFRTLAGLVRPSSGKIRINDKELFKDIDHLPSLGMIIENVGLYPDFSGFDNLKYLASIHKLVSDEEIKQAITRVGLDPNDKRKVRKYSLGMKQRIVLAQAIMEKPDILLLDEPTNALDEDGILLIRNIVKEEKERGALILVASHNKEDIHLLCDQVYQIEYGAIVSSYRNEGE